MAKTTENRSGLKLRAQLALSFSAIAFILIALSTVVSYTTFRGQLRQSTRDRLLDLTSVVASQVNGDNHALLNNPKDQQGPAYQEIWQSLMDLQRGSQDFGSAYTMRAGEAGQILLIVDGAEDPEPLGEVYSDPGPVLGQNFLTMDQPMAEDDYYTDEWGTWLSAYAPFYRSDGSREGIVGIDINAESIISREWRALWAGLALIAISLPVTLVLGWIFGQRLAAPVGVLTGAVKKFARGETPGTREMESIQRLSSRRDEIGQMGGAFVELATYLHHIQEFAAALTQGDLTVRGIARSQQDDLGMGFERMAASFRATIGQFTDNVKRLKAASEQLLHSARQTDNASMQIAAAVKQVAIGSNQQAEGAAHTAASVEKIGRLIESVAQDAQGQARTVENAFTVVGQIGDAIRLVSSHVNAFSNNSARAAESARSGAQTVQHAIQGMDTIKSQVDLSTQKVRDMGQRSNQIGEIVETIDDIASQTNLLALNAAIEAAHAGGAWQTLSEKLLQDHLFCACSLLAELLASHPEKIDSEELSRLAEMSKVDTLQVTDEDGVILYSSQPENVGFRFPESSHGQAAGFRSLLESSTGVLRQPVQAREQDGKPYLYLGISRKDRRGIIQAGVPGSYVLSFSSSVNGFAVVAEEVRKLAERVALETREIGALVHSIQKSVGEAVLAMDQSTLQVESGVVNTHQAGEALSSILDVAETVHRQAEEASTIVQRMVASSDELVKAMDAVSAVTQKNSTSTGKMAAGSAEITHSIEDIASVSEENSAAVEEVNAKTEEVNELVSAVTAAAQNLAGMAQTLEQSLLQFKGV